jgi:hypothetical protein
MLHKPRQRPTLTKRHGSDVAKMQAMSGLSLQMRELPPIGTRTNRVFAEGVRRRGRAVGGPQSPCRQIAKMVSPFLSPCWRLSGVRDRCAVARRVREGCVGFVQSRIAG